MVSKASMLARRAGIVKRKPGELLLTYTRVSQLEKAPSQLDEALHLISPAVNT